MELVAKYGAQGALALILLTIILALVRRATEQVYDHLRKRPDKLREILPNLLQLGIATAIWYWLSRNPGAPVTHTELVAFFSLVVLYVGIGQVSLFSDIRFTWRLMIDSVRPRVGEKTPP